MSTFGAALGGASCERTTASCESMVSLARQQGQVTSTGGTGFFAMPLFYFKKTTVARDKQEYRNKVMGRSSRRTGIYLKTERLERQNTHHRSIGWLGRIRPSTLPVPVIEKRASPTGRSIRRPSA